METKKKRERGERVTSNFHLFLKLRKKGKKRRGGKGIGDPKEKKRGEGEEKRGKTEHHKDPLR